jgi:uncharacterized protein involved in outer membrane biogenesis
MSEATPPPRRSVAARALLGLAIFAAAAALVFLAVRLVIDGVASEGSRRIIEQRLSAALGLEVEIRGGLQVEVLPSPRFRVHELVVLNPPGEPTPYLLQVGTVDLSFDLIALLSGEIEITGLDLSDAMIHYDGELGALAIRPRLETLADEEKEKTLPFEIRSLELDQVNIFYGDAEDGGLWSIHVDRFELASPRFNAPVTLSVSGTMQGSVFDLEGEIGPLSQLAAPKDPFPIHLQGRVFEGDVEIRGQIAAPMAFEGVDLEFSAALADIGALLSESEHPLSHLGPIDVEGRLADRDNALAIENLQVTISDSAVRGTLHGSIGDIAAGTGVDLDLGVSLDDMSLLEAITDRSLPNLAPVVLSANLSDRDGSVGVTARVSAGNADGDLRVQLEGSHGDLRRMGDLDVHFEIEARDLTLIGEELGLERPLPPIGPVTLKGHFEGEEGALGVDDLAFEIGSRKSIWAEGEGAIGNIADLSNIEVAVRFGAQDLRELGALTGGKPPDVGPIQGGASLTDRDGTLGIEHFHARGGREGVLDLEVLGSFDDVTDLDEISVQARLEARDLSVVGELAGMDFPPLGPVSFRGNVKGSKGKIQSHGEARIDQTTLTGDWSATFGGGARPRVELALSSPRVRLRDIGIEPSDAQLLRDIPPETVREIAEGWWEGSSELPFDQLRSVDGRITLDIARVTGRNDFLLADAEATIALEDGDLDVQRFAATYEEGSLDGTLRIDARTALPELSLAGRISGASLAVLMSQLMKETRSSGILDASFDLHSRGQSVDQVRSSLSGRFQARVRDWALASIYMDRVVKNMVRAFIRSDDDDPLDALDCVAANLEIESGIAKVRTFVLETEGATVRGKGKIDLRKETFKVTLTPEVHSPALLGIAARVYVTGPLSDPEFRSSTRSLATSATRGLLYNLLRPGRAVFEAFVGSTGKPRSIDAVCQPATVASGAASLDPS